MSGQAVKILIVFGCLLFAGCFSSGGGSDLDRGPREAFERWIEILETRDFEGMWQKLPMTAKERFRYSWEEEKEQLKKSSEEFKQGFIKKHGYSGWAEVKAEDAKGFFVRSMKTWDDGKFPKKYQILKESTIDDYEYSADGFACVLTFKGPDGTILPLKMKLQKEGEDWQVIRMP